MSPIWNVYNKHFSLKTFQTPGSIVDCQHLSSHLSHNKMSGDIPDKGTKLGALLGENLVILISSSDHLRRAVMVFALYTHPPPPATHHINFSQLFLSSLWSDLKLMPYVKKIWVSTSLSSLIKAGLLIYLPARIQQRGRDHVGVLLDFKLSELVKTLGQFSREKYKELSADFYF